MDDDGVGRGAHSSWLCAFAHLCAVAAAAEGGVRGPDGLRGGAAVDLGVDGAVAYWRTVIVCNRKPMDGYSQ